MLNSPNFSISFQLFQQEAFLAQSNLLSGFDHLIKGNHVERHKGGYYLAFFSLSTALERFMKLLLATDYMCNNNFSRITTNELKKFGHNISSLYKHVIDIGAVDTQSKLKNKIIEFFTYFADADNGRYYNFNNKLNCSTNEIFKKWSEIIEITQEVHFSEKIISNIEKKSWSERRREKLISEKANHFIIWEILQILKPIISKLNDLSSKQYDTDVKGGMKFPEYYEIFSFISTDKARSIRIKNWSRAFIYY